MNHTLKIWLLIFCLNVAILISGCIDNGSEEVRNDSLYFQFKYSSSSSVEGNVNITIITMNETIFNETISLEIGMEIYFEEARGGVYNITIEWNGIVEMVEYEPVGIDTLYLVINKYITFQIVTAD